MKYLNKDSAEWGFSKFIKISDISGTYMQDHLYIEGLFKSKVIMENLKSQMHITAGIKNEGTTCYINSLLQTLFIIAPLRKAVFKMPSDEHNTIPLCLQRIFYNLQFSKEPVRISDLLRSFGWQTHEANIQHDVMEFNCILSDKLEKKMEKIPELKGTYSKIFEGEFVNF